MAFSFQSLITRSLTSTTGDIDEVQTRTKFIRWTSLLSTQPRVLVPSLRSSPILPTMIDLIS